MRKILLVSAFFLQLTLYSSVFVLCGWVISQVLKPTFKNMNYNSIWEFIAFCIFLAFIGTQQQKTL